MFCVCLAKRTFSARVGRGGSVAAGTNAMPRRHGRSRSVGSSHPQLSWARTTGPPAARHAAGVKSPISSRRATAPSTPACCRRPPLRSARQLARAGTSAAPLLPLRCGVCLCHPPPLLLSQPPAAGVAVAHPPGLSQGGEGGLQVQGGTARGGGTAATTAGEATTTAATALTTATALAAAATAATAAPAALATATAELGLGLRESREGRVARAG